MMSIRSIGLSRFVFALAFLTTLAIHAGWAKPSYALVTSTAAHSETFDGFDAMLSSTDLIQGMIPFENPGDLGWHPANTAPADRLPAFTDGLGGTNDLTGLLNDTATSPQFWGLPVKLVEYVFDSAVDIGRINLLTGNKVNSDGRIFSTTVVNYSTDGINFDLLGYFQSDPSGVVNNWQSPVAPFDPVQAATFVSIFDNSSSTMLSGITNLEFHFYSVSNTQGQMRDPFDGENPFTLTDDNLAPAFESPLVWEIDVLAPVEGIEGDHNGDGLVDAADYVYWRDQLGNPPGYDAWKLNFGGTIGSGAVAATVPEPASWVYLLLLTLAAALRFRGRLG